MYWELIESRNDILFSLYPHGLAQYLVGNKYLSLEVLALIGHSSTHWFTSYYIHTLIIECLQCTWAPCLWGCSSGMGKGGWDSILFFIKY